MFDASLIVIVEFYVFNFKLFLFHFKDNKFIWLLGRFLFPSYPSQLLMNELHHYVCSHRPDIAFVIAGSA